MYANARYDPVRVIIYPDNCASSFGRRITLLLASASATTAAVAVLCVAASTLVWTGHIGRRTPATVATSDLFNDVVESDGQLFD